MRYTIRAAAIATGVSESSLRTWERRYGIPRPARSATGRRLYTEDDLTVIRRMAAFVQASIPASEAAAAAKAGETAVPVPPPEEAAEEHPFALAIADASQEFDARSTLDAIDRAVSDLGWPGAIDQVLMPALRLIGESWRDSELDLSNEHFTSELVRRRLNGAILEVPPAPNGAPKVLLACPEDERHEFGVLAACLLLGQLGIQTVYLGPDVPTPSLLGAAKKAGVDALCLSATTDPGLAMLTRAVREIANARLPIKVFVGGRALHEGAADGILGIVLPDSIERTASVIHDALTA